MGLKSAITAYNAQDKFSNLGSIVDGIGKELGTAMLAVNSAAVNTVCTWAGGSCDNIQV